jgi:hypothetical protein
MFLKDFEFESEAVGSNEHRLIWHKLVKSAQRTRTRNQRWSRPIYDERAKLLTPSPLLTPDVVASARLAMADAVRELVNT